MFKKLQTRLAIAFLLLGPLSAGISYAQEEERAAKKAQTIDIEIDVADKDGNPIDNVQVMVKWGDGESESQKAGVTDKHGIARVKDVPQETVKIRLIANGYKPVAPSVNLKTEKQPIKLALEKDGHHVGE